MSSSVSTARTKHPTLTTPAVHDAVPSARRSSAGDGSRPSSGISLSTNYFHVVFTVPHELNPLALTSPRPFLDLLFDASSQTLLEVARRS